MLNKIAFLPLLALTGLAVLPSSADAVERRNEQNDARAQMMAGKVKSLRSIENKVLPKMKGRQYLGPEFDPVTQIYRLKFIRDGRLEYVDVRGSDGTIIRHHK